MNPSYSHLAAAYDQLFPLDLDAVTMVERSLIHLVGSKIIDAGCGTGLMARALADRGARVHGFDLDPSLLQRAIARGGSGVDFVVGDLRTWTAPVGFAPVNAVLCLGNTLPHLTKESELVAFLARAAQNLCPRGVLIVQLLDYDRLDRLGIRELPLLAAGRWTLRRSYEVLPEGLWNFTTELVEAGKSAGQTNSFPLRPWRRVDLEAVFCSSGFVLTGVFGGFDGRPAGNSLPLVFVARLGLE